MREIFAQRITEALKNCDISQKEIAKRLHIRESNISNWKNGDNLPSIEILHDLCQIIDESADYLIGLDIKKNATNSVKIQIIQL